MDDFTIYLGSHRRAHPGPPPLAHLGWLADKRHRIALAFPTLNFSFILGGGGDYQHKGRSLTVEAPMVLTQWPGEPMDYGPEGTWSEFYLIYQPEAEAWFRTAGLFDRSRPVWRLGEATRIRHRIDELLALARNLAQSDVRRDIDRIDRLAESIVLEAVLAQAAAPAQRGPERAVEDLRRKIEADPARIPNVAALARRHGLSGTHLRRLWQGAVGVPPARYAMQLRLRRAASLLVEDPASVAAIAEQVGFSDPLHFSRRFTAFIGLSPTAHRERWRRVRQE